jgi:outer membrane protein assembly factor BamB
VWNSAVYFGSTDGNVYCVDLKKGELLWRFSTEGQIISSPTVVNNTVYIGSTDHHLYALPA